VRQSPREETGSFIFVHIPTLLVRTGWTGTRLLSMEEYIEIHQTLTWSGETALVPVLTSLSSIGLIWTGWVRVMPDKDGGLTSASQGPDLSGQEYLPFTVRYGLSTVMEDHKGQRHEFRHRSQVGYNCEKRLELRCVCPGLQEASVGCCEKATQEDRLCDSCRTFCYGVELVNGEVPDDGEIVPLVKGRGEFSWETFTVVPPPARA
jgi:hypothetical protein